MSSDKVENQIRDDNVQKLQVPSHNPNRKMLFRYCSHSQHNRRDGYNAKFHSFTFYDDLTCERMDGFAAVSSDYPGMYEHHHFENIYYGTWKVVCCCNLADVVVGGDKNKNKKKIVITESDVFRAKMSNRGPGELKKRKDDEHRNKDHEEFPLDDDHLYRKNSENFGEDDGLTYKLEGDAKEFLEFCQKQIIA